MKKIFLLIIMFFMSTSSYSYDFYQEKISEECLVWALGEGYGTQNIYDLFEIWNSRHGDIEVILGSQNVSDLFYLIINSCNDINK